MYWVRTFLVSLLHSALLVTLLIGAVLFGVGNILQNPIKIERFLTSPSVYQKLLDEGTQRSQDLGDATTQSILTSNSALEIRSALGTAFPKSFLNSSAHSLIDANNAWLRGATSVPHFKVDFADGKKRFAATVSRVITMRLRAIPECTLAQLRMIQTSNLSTLTCRPPGIDVGVEEIQVEQQIVHNQNFINNGAITQDTLTLGQDHNPYYHKLSWLPRVFQALRYAPYVCAVLAIMLGLVALYTLPDRRRGLGKIARTLIIAGIVLASAKIAVIIGYNELRSYLLHSGVTGPLQNIVLSITHEALGAFANTELLLGTACIVLAMIISFGLIITRLTGRKQQNGDKDDDASVQQPEAETNAVASVTKKRRPVMDIIGRPSQVALVPEPQTAPENTSLEPNKKTSKLGKRGIIQ